MLILLDHLSSVELPQEVLGAYSGADSYWRSSRGDRSVLVAAKVTCWQYLRHSRPSRDTMVENERHVRALLCVLEPDGDEESASMTAEWFAEMLAEGR